MSRARATMHKIPVKVTRSGGEAKFDAGSELWDDPSGALRFHKDHHGMRAKDFHLIEFVLDDRTGEGLRFPDVPHDAMWVSRTEPGKETPCPTRDNGGDYDVIEPICVCDEGQRLIVRNDNPRKEQWAFTLNLVKPGGDPSSAQHFVSWDPIIDNQDGGHIEDI